jgi:hypothetical protein
MCKPAAANSQGGFHFNSDNEAGQFERSRTWQEKAELTEELHGRVNEPQFTDEVLLTREATNIDLDQLTPPLDQWLEQLPVIGEEGTPERMEPTSMDTM